MSPTRLSGASTSAQNRPNSSSSPTIVSRSACSKPGQLGEALGVDEVLEDEADVAERGASRRRPWRRRYDDAERRGGKPDVGRAATASRRGAHAGGEQRGDLVGGRRRTAAQRLDRAPRLGDARAPALEREQDRAGAPAREVDEELEDARLGFDVGDVAEAIGDVEEHGIEVAGREVGDDGVAVDGDGRGRAAGRRSVVRGRRRRRVGFVESRRQDPVGRRRRRPSPGRTPGPRRRRRGGYGGARRGRRPAARHRSTPAVDAEQAASGVEVHRRQRSVTARASFPPLPRRGSGSTSAAPGIKGAPVDLESGRLLEARGTATHAEAGRARARRRRRRRDRRPLRVGRPDRLHVPRRREARASRSRPPTSDRSCGSASTPTPC